MWYACYPLKVQRWIHFLINEWLNVVSHFLKGSIICCSWNQPCRWHCPCMRSPPALPRTRAGSWTGSCLARRACSPPGTRWLQCRCLCASSSAAGGHRWNKTIAETSQITSSGVTSKGLSQERLTDGLKINVVWAERWTRFQSKITTSSLRCPTIYQVM